MPVFLFKDHVTKKCITFFLKESKLTSTKPWMQQEFLLVLRAV